MKTIVLEGPGKNSLSTVLLRQTLHEVRASGDQPIFLTGAGDVFSAGLNLKEIASLDPSGMQQFLGTLEELVAALYTHPGPTVAYVNGHAIAGGCVLALCCDVRVMTSREGARIGLNEVAIGLQFPPRTFAMIRARLASPALDRVILEAELHPAAQAMELGLVDALGEEAEARARLEKLAGYPRHVYAATKAALRGKLDVPTEVQHRYLDQVLPAWTSPELKTRLLALLKR
jgi:enoyl-CoA hydratase/carnithine racemase